MSVSSRVIATSEIRWKDLQFIQQDDFKVWIPEAEVKLQQSLLKYQFIDPFKVWENEGILYCLDGKHRYDDLCTLESQGVMVPERLPATFIACKDKKEAAELVLVYSSAYAKITNEGLFEFVKNYDIEIPEIKETISIPDFSFERFEQKYDYFGVQDLSADEDPEFGVSDLEIVVQPGDVFQLGDHRIVCGSFMDREVQNSLMGGQRARILFCDPPYNLPSDVFLGSGRHNNFSMGAGEMTPEQFSEFLQLVMRTSILHTVPGAIHYIFMDFRHQWEMTEAARHAYGNPHPKQMCVWVKDRMANGAFYRSQQELCYVFSDEKAKALWNKDLLDEGGFYKNDNELCYIFKNGDGAKHLSHLELKDRIRTNVWRYPSGNSTANPDRYELKNHPTPKPVAMIADAVLDTTNPDDQVIDWFLGSGSTLIACEKTGRKCRGSDIEPKYIQHIICRYYRYCEKTGRGFEFRHLNGELTAEQILQIETA